MVRNKSNQTGQKDWNHERGRMESQNRTNCSTLQKPNLKSSFKIETRDLVILIFLRTNPKSETKKKIKIETKRKSKIGKLKL